MSQAELILALDVSGADPARRLLDRLPDVRWVKIGSILMTREGPGLVRELVERGLLVFLDLKWHDIPNTVREAVEAARELRVAMATVHTLGGPEMMAAAAEAAGDHLAVVGVTVLTSHTPATYGSAVGRPVPDLAMEVVRQARNAISAGLHGLVCSPHEAAVVHAAVGAGPRIVVPGIRRPEDARDDQSRSAGPAEAVQSGATHLVVGRPVLRAADPGRVWDSLVAALR
ncbi:MAG: Orotidine 5-phosphate decarboxylase [Gemmatimonadetes bacterium]|nr:Orotidine 5-phosphate decarboxylase [Gemmatimonadota bacterium]